MEPFLGQLLLVAFNFAPKGWALCDGQLMPINQNQALFSLLGTTYGGDGRVTFALPNLQGQTINGFGQGPGLANYNQGQRSGEESLVLTISQMPAHTHTFNATQSAANATTPVGHALADTESNSPSINPYTTNPASAGAALNPSAIGNVGGSQPHQNLQPFLVLNWIIALQGIFPSRN